MPTTKMHEKMILLTWLSFWALSLGVLTSTTLLALVHIFLLLPCVYFSIYGEDRRMSGSMISLLVMSAIIIISVLVNLDLDITGSAFKNISKVKYFILGTLSVFAFREYFKRPGALERMKYPFRALLIATSIGTIAGLIGLWTGYNPLRFAPACSAYRACGLFGMLMTYAYGLSFLMITLVTFWVLRRDLLFRWIAPHWFYLVMALNLYGLYATITRGAWLGFLLALPFIFFKRYAKWASIGLVAMVIAIVVGVQLLPKDFQTHVIRTESTTQRLTYFESAYRAFQEKPILGYGYRNFQHWVIDIKKRHSIGWDDLAGHAHNNFFEHLASTGAVGALAFLSFFIFWLVEMYRRKDIVSDIAFVFIISFTVSGMSQYTFGDGANVFFLMGIYAFSQVKPQFALDPSASY